MVFLHFHYNLIEIFPEFITFPSTNIYSLKLTISCLQNLFKRPDHSSPLSSLSILLNHLKGTIMTTPFLLSLNMFNDALYCGEKKVKFCLLLHALIIHK